MRFSAMVPERFSVRASKVAVPMALESSSAPSASVRGEAQDLHQFGQMQEGLAVLLAPGGIERRDGLGEAPEVDALAGGHGVAVHDRLEVAEARHLVDNDQQVALKRFDAGDGVWDGYPQAKPALDVLDGVFRRDHEKVGIAIGQIQGIEAGTLRMGEKRGEVEE